MLLLFAVVLLSSIGVVSIVPTAAHPAPCAGACGPAAADPSPAAMPLAADLDSAEERAVAPLSAQRAMATAACPLHAEPALACRCYRRPALRPPAAA
ncbi:hypothetical protein NRY95_08640 [Xanthomonas campestris pv. phormiicola]|nr:hypothetical protein [Xanthomonas campestris pv. phormiicola]UYC18003.1 hypothetical protein NRY95_08640 [Xanthomonas campestris pv. phormiicola]